MKGHVRQLPSGRWRVYVSGGPDPARPGHYLQHMRVVKGTKREADKALRQLIREVEAGRNFDGAKRPLAELMDEWVTARGRDWSPATRHQYLSKINGRIVPGLGHIPVGQLTARHIDAFLEASRAEGLAVGTVRQLHAIIRAALSQAEKWGYVERNVAKLATPPPASTAEMEVPTVEQFHAILTEAEKVSPALGVFIWLAAVTGARRGELCGLRWSDLEVTYEEE